MDLSQPLLVPKSMNVHVQVEENVAPSTAEVVTLVLGYPTHVCLKLALIRPLIQAAHMTSSLTHSLVLVTPLVGILIIIHRRARVYPLAAKEVIGAQT